jgi:hypothetical protein
VSRDRLLRSFAGPLHRRLTGIVVGLHLAAGALAGCAAAGIDEEVAVRLWWTCLVMALLVTGPAAAAGIVDRAGLESDSGERGTANRHALMVGLATAVLLAAAGVGIDDIRDGTIEQSSLALTIGGLALLLAGARLGFAIVEAYGRRLSRLVAGDDD